MEMIRTNMINSVYMLSMISLYFWADSSQERALLYLLQKLKIMISYSKMKVEMIAPIIMLTPTMLRIQFDILLKLVFLKVFRSSSFLYKAPTKITMSMIMQIAKYPTSNWVSM